MTNHRQQLLMTTCHGRRWSSDTGLPSCLWRKPVVLCRGPASVSGSELLTCESLSLMGHRVPPLVECYTGGSSRGPRRRRSLPCSSPCGGVAPLLVGEQLLSLWRSCSSLKRWSSCCCSSTAACRLFCALERRIVNKLPAVTSSPPPFLRTAILILSNTCQKSAHVC